MLHCATFRNSSRMPQPTHTIQFAWKCCKVAVKDVAATGRGVGHDNRDAMALSATSAAFLARVCDDVRTVVATATTSSLDTQAVVAATEDFVAPLVATAVSRRPLLLVAASDTQVTRVAVHVAAVVAAFADAEVVHIHAKHCVSRPHFALRVLFPHDHVAFRAVEHPLPSPTGPVPTSPLSTLFTTSNAARTKSPRSRPARSSSAVDDIATGRTPSHRSHRSKRNDSSASASIVSAAGYVSSDGQSLSSSPPTTSPEHAIASHSNSFTESSSHSSCSSSSYTSSYSSSRSRSSSASSSASSPSRLDSTSNLPRKGTNVSSSKSVQAAVAELNAISKTSLDNDTSLNTSGRQSSRTSEGGGHRDIPRRNDENLGLNLLQKRSSAKRNSDLSKPRLSVITSAASRSGSTSRVKSPIMGGPDDSVRDLEELDDDEILLPALERMSTTMSNSMPVSQARRALSISNQQTDASGHTSGWNSISKASELFGGESKHVAGRSGFSSKADSHKRGVSGLFDDSRVDFALDNDVMLGGKVPNIILMSDVSAMSITAMDALIELLQTRKIDYNGNSYICPQMFLVIGIVRQSAMMKLPWELRDEALLSYNWFHKVDVGSALLSVTQSSPWTSVADLEALYKFLGQVYIHRDVARYARDLISFVRNHQFVFKGVSSRVSEDLMLSAKCLALISGRSHVISEDIKTLAVSVISHRVSLNQWSVNSATRTKVTSTEVVLSCLKKLAAP